MKISLVMGIVFRKNQNRYEYLLLKRTPEEGGFWQPPGGVLEKEDSSKLQGCLREVEEETGISKDKISKIIEKVYSFAITEHYLTKKAIEPVIQEVFGLETDPTIAVKLDANHKKEHDTFRWVPYEEAMKLLLWENNKEAFRRLNERLA